MICRTHPIGFWGNPRTRKFPTLRGHCLCMLFIPRGFWMAAANSQSFLIHVVCKSIRPAQGFLSSSCSPIAVAVLSLPLIRRTRSQKTESLTLYFCSALSCLWTNKGHEICHPFGKGGGGEVLLDHPNPTPHPHSHPTQPYTPHRVGRPLSTSPIQKHMVGPLLRADQISEILA